MVKSFYISMVSLKHLFNNIKDSILYLITIRLYAEGTKFLYSCLGGSFFVPNLFQSLKLWKRLTAVCKTKSGLQINEARFYFILFYLKVQYPTPDIS